MHLLNTETFALKEFMGEAEKPLYAILSHTWGEHEVSYQEMQYANKINIDEEKQGYKKIKAACNKARDNGFTWIWIDTCCIDKSSSAELSEAINSMYHWYRSAGMCYAYLADVPTLEASNLDALQSCLARSLWFTRGWTLQELIAPARVEFLSADWSSTAIATKSNQNRDVKFCRLLSKITGVDMDVLRGIKPLATLEIAIRMSWASERVTTRPEDIAYCLLGLFDVSIPLLYGEGGKKAFIRLQEELMRNSDDQSLFVWTQETGNPPIRGPLADSPAEFASSRNISSFSNWMRSLPYSMTNLGLQISLPVIPIESQSSGATSKYPKTHIGVLNCVRGQLREKRLAIGLCRLTPAGDQYARVDVETLQAYTNVVKSDDIKTIYIRKQILEADTSLENAYFIDIAKIPEGFKVKSVWPQNEWDPKERSIRQLLQIVGGPITASKVAYDFLKSLREIDRDP
ncbi:MAG: hypothetical protein M1821_007758 [Bathelium mastoideum]|nr:MAG: hypothetical protein M1821_007758 [Bathelium mastoideum]